MFSSRKREKGSPRERPASRECCSGVMAPRSLHCSNRVNMVTQVSFPVRPAAPRNVGHISDINQSYIKRDCTYCFRFFWRRAVSMGLVSADRINLLVPAPGREWIVGTIARRVTANDPWVLAATILGSSMAFIDGTVVNVALPALQSALGATIAQVQWVVESYALFLAALLLVGGSLGDIYGRRKVFVAGVVL